jgi:tetratricopeptide (TPR) repeat protein
MRLTLKIFQAETAVPALLLMLLMSTSSTAQKSNLPERLENAASLIRANRAQEAEKQLVSILNSTPNEPQALNLLGTIRGSQGRLDEAEKLFTRAIGIDSRLIAARMNLAYLHLLNGAPDKTIAELKEIIRLEPSHTEALYKLATLLLSRGRADECIATVEASKLSLQVSPALLVVLGDAYLKTGNGDKAEANYLQAVSAQSNSAGALIGLAKASQLKGDTKAVTIYLTRAKQFLDGSAEFLYSFGVVAFKAGMYEDSRQALEQATALKPGEAGYFVALGAVWLKKPDLFEAERIFKRALELQPQNYQAQMYLGYTLLKQKKHSEARLYLEMSLKGEPKIPETRYYLGLLAQEQGEDSRAVEILAPLVQQFPTFSNAHLALGSSYMKIKNYPAAKLELELAVKLDPDEPKAHYNLAMLYARLKDTKGAQREMEIVEKLKNRAQSKENDGISPSFRDPR